MRVLPLRQWHLQLVGRGTPPAVPLTLACSSARPPASVSASSIFFCMACTRARGPLDVQPHVAVVCIAVLRRVSTVTRHAVAVAAMVVVGCGRDAHALLLLQSLRCRHPPKLLHDNVRWGGTGLAFKDALTVTNTHRPRLGRVAVSKAFRLKAQSFPEDVRAATKSSSGVRCAPGPRQRGTALHVAREPRRGGS